MITQALPQPHSPSQTASAELSWQLYSADRLAEGLDVWRQLERRLGDVPLACSTTWTECWLRCYGDVVGHQIAIARSGGQPRAACLLADGVGQKLGFSRIRTRHLGTAGEPQPGSVCVEYNALLMDPQDRELVLPSLADLLRRDSHWEQLRLDGFAEEDLAFWQKEFPETRIHSRDSRYFDLREARAAGGDVISRLGRSTRSNLRRRLKQYGDLQCEWADSISTASSIFHELVELHQARWKAVGAPGAFASPRFLQFQQTAGLQLFLENKAVFFRVRHQGETVGCLMLLVDRNRLLDYLSGFAPFDVKPSPGLISHYLCQEAALTRGYDAYDFLVGDKQHKDNLSTGVNQLCWLTWSRPSLKMRMLESLRTLKGRMREYTRRVPAEAAEVTTADS